MAPNTYFAEEAAIIHCLVHAAKAKLLTSLQHSQITEADVIMGKVDDEDTSVFRIAARLAAWNNYTETDDDGRPRGHSCMQAVNPLPFQWGSSSRPVEISA